MINYKRTNSENVDFRLLVSMLDADLTLREGDHYAFFAQFNRIDKIKHVVVAYFNGVAVGCGAIKEYSPSIMEVKRMFVSKQSRGKGIASGILHELEEWANELNYEKCILETGDKQPEAIALYKKNQYKIIPNYGQYEKVESSTCFEKTLRRKD